MAEPTLGQIQAFGFKFAPRFWSTCDGQILEISSNTALFSLLGTEYGGDGRTTFALPDLRGRSIVHQGTGPGLPTATIGHRGGSEFFTLTEANMPPHNHSVTATLHGETSVGDSRNPKDRLLASPAAGTNIYASPVEADNKAMSSESIVVTQQTVGGGQAVAHTSPHLVVNVCIALQGLFPSRN
jgi:microcystin-dependent protein